MFTVKVAAAVIGLAVCSMFVIHGGETLGSGSIRYLAWSESGLLGAPARAVKCIISGGFVLAAVWLYRLLFSPLVLLRTPDDVGYIAEDGRSKARAANEVRRRRKIGDLPPVYPNGWYRVLDSHMLERGDVKNVTALGKL